MDAATVRERASELPTEPGVYQFVAGETTLYVGKAVDLRDRVRSYADPRSERIASMVERAEGIEIAVTDTETQALLLEANFIKRLSPRYNVRLTDDKSYPLVQLTDHEAPRIEITRDPDPDATVYGPFTNRGRVETVLKALRETFGLRGCSDHKYAGRDRPCVDHEIGLCTAPCTGEIDAESYLADVRSVRRFFEGERGVLTMPLEREMERAATERAFERAANLRDRLDAIGALGGEAGTAVRSHGGGETMDALGVAVEGERATVARLRAEGGGIVDRDRVSVETPDGAAVGEVLAAFVPQYYADRELPEALLVPEAPVDRDLRGWLDGEGVALRVPGVGREATLVELAIKNARTRTGRGDEAAALADALGLDRIGRIEGVDVSHSGGREVVGSNVAFVDGDPEKSAYRRRKLPDENDDPASIRRLVRWRAERAVEGRDDRPDPDLLLVDGGDGQLRAARDALAEIGWDVPAIGIAKDERRSGDDRLVTADGVVNPPRDAPHLRLCQRVRDEAHRFAVQYHQSRRDSVETVLDDLPGVGPELRSRLLDRFGSVAGVRAATRDELRAVPGVGPATAETIDDRL